MVVRQVKTQSTFFTIPNLLPVTNANIQRVAPKINVAAMHNSVGTIESGNVEMALPEPKRLTIERKKKRKSKKNVKRKRKTTNKRKVKE